MFRFTVPSQWSLSSQSCVLSAHWCFFQSVMSAVCWRSSVPTVSVSFSRLLPSTAPPDVHLCSCLPVDSIGGFAATCIWCGNTNTVSHGWPVRAGLRQNVYICSRPLMIIIINIATRNENICHCTHFILILSLCTAKLLCISLFIWSTSTLLKWNQSHHRHRKISKKRCAQTLFQTEGRDSEMGQIAALPSDERSSVFTVLWYRMCSDGHSVKGATSGLGSVFFSVSSASDVSNKYTIFASASLTSYAQVWNLYFLYFFSYFIIIH